MDNRELPPKVKAFLEKEKSNYIQEPDDITVKDAQEAWGLSRSSATEKLNGLAEAGKLVKCRGRLLSGANGLFFRIPTDER